MTASKISLTPTDLALASRMARSRHVINLRAGSRNNRIHAAPDMAIDEVGARGAVAFCRLAHVDLAPYERAGVQKGGIAVTWRGLQLRVASATCRQPSYVQHPDRAFDVDIAVVMECTSLMTHTWKLSGWLTLDDFRRYARQGDLGRGRTVVVAHRFLRPASELWAIKDASAPEQLTMAVLA